jgi:hypothetical protein
MPVPQPVLLEVQEDLRMYQYNLYLFQWPKFRRIPFGWREGVGWVGDGKDPCVFPSIGESRGGQVGDPP